MKKIIRTFLALSLVAIVSFSFSACSEEDCGDCTTDLITQEINIDGAILRMYNGKPIIYGAFYTGNLTQKAYCYICNENAAKDLIKKVKDGGMITVNVKGKLRELREGEEQVNPNTWNYDETSFTCDIQILKIKKK